MTAAVATDGTSPLDDPDVIISATIRALVAARQTDTGELAAALRMSRNSYYNRINGEKPWHARDVSRAAAFFDVPVADLYEGRLTIPFRKAGAPQTIKPRRTMIDESVTVR